MLEQGAASPNAAPVSVSPCRGADFLRSVPVSVWPYGKGVDGFGRHLRHRASCAGASIYPDEGASLAARIRRVAMAAT